MIRFLPFFFSKISEDNAINGFGLVNLSSVFILLYLTSVCLTLGLRLPLSLLLSNGFHIAQDYFLFCMLIDSFYFFLDSLGNVFFEFFEISIFMAASGWLR